MNSNRLVARVLGIMVLLVTLVILITVAATGQEAREKIKITESNNKSWVVTVYTQSHTKKVLRLTDPEYRMVCYFLDELGGDLGGINCVKY